MSRRNSQEKLAPSAHSTRNQGKPLNIIDFIMRQKFQDKAPSTIAFSEEHQKVKACEMCLTLQEEMSKLVDSDRFAQVIEKIWNKVKRLEEENQKSLIKVGNLERALVQQQGMLEELSKPTEQVTSREEKNEKVEKNEKSDKKISKEFVASLKSVEDNLLKTLNKEITQKFMVMQEKQEEMNLLFAGIDEQIQMLSHKHSMTREECDERINSIASLVKENNEFLRANNHGIVEMSQHYSDMDADLMKIFQHIKTLLQTDYKVAELDSQIGSLKSQLSQLRNAVNEIGDFVSKI